MALEHMNNRYFLQLSYFGKSFSGWQRQENAVTVQGALEEALKIRWLAADELIQEFTQLLL